MKDKKYIDEALLRLVVADAASGGTDAIAKLRDTYPELGEVLDAYKMLLEDK